MGVASIQLGSETAADPNAKPAANIVETTTGVQVDPNKPAENATDTSKLILGKFKDQAALESAYTEAQQKITELSQAKPDASKAGEADKAKLAVEQSGIDIAAISKEYAAKGELTPETLKGLEAKGVSKAMVDAYIGGLKAQATQFRATLAEVAGGEDALKSVYEWASTNMSQEELAAYNATVESGNVPASKLALQGVVARFTAATGQEPALVKDTAAAAASGVLPFKSNAEIVKAMGDPKYKTDQAYRAEVAARLNVTDMSFAN